MGDDVAITGIGIISHFGRGLNPHCDAWQGGSETAARPIERFVTDGFSVSQGFGCPDVKPRDLPVKKSAKVLSQKDRQAVLAIQDAFDDARLSSDINPEQLGVFVGAGSNQLGDLSPYFTAVGNCVDAQNGRFDSVKFGAKMDEFLNPMIVMQTLLNNALCFGSQQIDARGPNGNYMDPEIASGRAIQEACTAIRENRCKWAIAGGVAPTFEPFQLQESFDDGRFLNGSLPAEGAAFLVLESSDTAFKRGANIYGWIRNVVLSRGTSQRATANCPTVEVSPTPFRTAASSSDSTIDFVARSGDFFEASSVMGIIFSIVTIAEGARSGKTGAGNEVRIRSRNRFGCESEIALEVRL